jgi:hypothetical protein
MSPHIKRVQVAGVPTALRLTVGGLAEIAKQLACESPSELSARLRKAHTADWNDVLSALATPRLEGQLSEENIAELLPEISALIVEALA